MARIHSLVSVGKHACHENARKLDHALQRLSNAPDAAAVHDVRVACRRLQTALEIIEPLYHSLEPHRKNIKKLLKTLSAVRDVEVLSERARGLQPQRRDGRLTPATHPAITGALYVADLLDAKVELMRVESAADASHAGTLNLPHQIEKAVHALGLHRGKLKRFPRIRVHQFAAKSLQDFLREVKALNIRRSSSADELHNLRLVFKKFRYAAEFFAPALHGREILQLAKQAERYQQILGDLHDADVALVEYRRWHAVHAPAKVDAQKQSTPAQRRYRLIQFGISKLLNQARNDQTRLRAAFFKIWTARHLREFAKLIASINPD